LDAKPVLGWQTALLRGWRGRCPRCGDGRLFRRYLKPVERCAVCGETWGALRADDFPPYATLFTIGLLFAPFFILCQRYNVPVLTEVGIAVVLTVALSLLLLPRFKGAILGLMWSLGLGGRENL
jgi:uncharacterized protein (DUF983 family)